MAHTNVKAVEYIISTHFYDYENTERIVEALVKGGFIDPDPIHVTKPEEYAAKAKRYLASCSCRSPELTFERASGWDDDGWEFVLDEKINTLVRQNIYKALQILEKEIGKQ